MKQWIRHVSLLPIAMTAMSAPAAMAADGLIPAQTLSRGLAIDIATRAVEICAAQGYAVSVSVADAAGNVRTTITADGALAIGVETGRRKAHTAAILRAPTSQIQVGVAAAPAFAAMLNSVDPFMLPLGGGVPIMAKSGLVGAIGIGGAPDGGKDEACALAALKAVAARLD